MIINDKRQIIVIEALRCYRDKLVSMKIDAKPVTEFLDEFRREKEKVEVEENKKKQEAAIRHPQTGKTIDAEEKA
tara:strand:- start:269 stop:493 length:225 start_codon:yes stop_codon:yes gene_type:complete